MVHQLKAEAPLEVAVVPIQEADQAELKENLEEVVVLHEAFAAGLHAAVLHAAGHGAHAAGLHAAGVIINEALTKTAPNGKLMEIGETTNTTVAANLAAGTMDVGRKEDFKTNKEAKKEPKKEAVEATSRSLPNTPKMPTALSRRKSPH